MMSCWLGVDLGGTGTGLGLVNHDGLIAMDHFPTRADDGPELWLRALKEHADDLLAEHGATALGIGLAAPGVLDLTTGRLINAFNLPKFVDFAIKEKIERTFALPCALENDANLYAFGEYHFGADRQIRAMACLTLGTGVGGGMVLDGKLISGPGATAELGHILVEPEGFRCSCGVRGCLEAYASIAGIGNILQQLLAMDGDSILKSDDSPEMVFEAASKGDGIALRVFEQAGIMLGRAIAVLACTVGVDLVVIGGGISPAWPFMKAATRRELKRRLKMTDPTGIGIVQSKLGGKAPILGAAALCMEQTSHSGKITHD